MLGAGKGLPPASVTQAQEAISIAGISSVPGIPCWGAESLASAGKGQHGAMLMAPCRACAHGEGVPAGRVQRSSPRSTPANAAALSRCREDGEGAGRVLPVLSGAVRGRALQQRPL